MATVTIGKSYFDALLRRAEFHTSEHDLDTKPTLTQNVLISKAEHDFMIQAINEYNLLKSALFRGGLTVDTLQTLLSAEGGVTEEEPTSQNTTLWEDTFVKAKSVPVTLTAPYTLSGAQSPNTDSTAVGDGLVQPRPHPRGHSGVYSFGLHDSSIESSAEDDNDLTNSNQRIPIHDQRSLHISNLSDRTTHKDLVDIIRGGRLLDIYIRNDRTATVSFVEGAHDFLAYAKRNDIYLHTKRLEIRWSERQFHVPPHVSNKIASGASRNVVVRGAANKLTADRIRDHLDHIHNLVVVDIKFLNGDAYISLNSIHNALFARTCMMSRTAYKGLRIEWYPDECAGPLPFKASRVQTPVYTAPTKSVALSNRYTLLNGDGADTDSEDEEDPHMINGIQINNWADATIA